MPPRSPAPESTGVSFPDVNQDYSSMIAAGLFALAPGSDLLALFVTTTPTATCGHHRTPNDREVNR